MMNALEFIKVFQRMCKKVWIILIVLFMLTI